LLTFCIREVTWRSRSKFARGRNRSGAEAKDGGGGQLLTFGTHFLIKTLD